MDMDREPLRRRLALELAALSARLSGAEVLGPREILNGAFELEGWLSRAAELGGSWQGETALWARVVGERTRAGRDPGESLERLMRLIIRASEGLDGFTESVDARQRAVG